MRYFALALLAAGITLLSPRAARADVVEPVFPEKKLSPLEKLTISLFELDRAVLWKRFAPDWLRARADWRSKIRWSMRPRQFARILRTVESYLYPDAMLPRWKSLRARWRRELHGAKTIADIRVLLGRLEHFICPNMVDWHR